MGEFSSTSGAAQSVLRAAVTGHRGTGRDTVAAALTEWFGITAARVDRPGAADLVVHVLGAAVRDCDRRFVARQKVPVVFVAGKADLRGPDGGSWQRCAAGLAARATQELSARVFPVSGLLACARIGGGLLADLDRWVDAAVTVPPIAAAFAEVADDAERRRRAAALVSLGAAGLASALAVRAAHPDLDASGLTRALRAGSGFRALASPIIAQGPVIAEERARRRRRDLTVRAAGRFADRDELERRVLAGVSDPTSGGWTGR